MGRGTGRFENGGGMMQTRRMKKFLLALVLVSSCAAAPPVQSPKGGGANSAETAARPASKVLDAGQLLEDVRVLSADAMEGRSVGTKGSAMARAYVARRFADAGLKPLWDSFEQPFALPSGGEGVNVVGYVRGTVHPERFIVVTAHYDHLGVRGGQVYNGADDNASGVAVLLQLAAHFGGARRPENSLIFAALDAEELGSVGAGALVKRLRRGKSNLVLNVNLDMVSRSHRGELYAAGAHHTPALRPLLERVASRAPVRLLLGHDRPEQGKDDWTKLSDQIAFHRAGVPFVYFGVEDHEDYHRPSDDFESISPDFFVRSAETILDSLQTLDGNLGELTKGKPKK